jgi:hypothetical protein
MLGCVSDDMAIWIGIWGKVSKQNRCYLLKYFRVLSTDELDSESIVRAAMSIFKHFISEYIHRIARFRRLRRKLDGMLKAFADYTARRSGVVRAKSGSTWENNEN